MRRSLLRLLVVGGFAALFACEGDQGPAGASGTNCTITDNGDGTQTISCEDGTTATVSDGTDGDNCTVADDGLGTKTITCDDGTVATVTDGTDVDPATLAAIQAQLDAAANVEPETCIVCHADSAMEKHQDVYDDYVDLSTFTLQIVSVVSSFEDAVLTNCMGTKSCKTDADCTGSCLDTDQDGAKFCENEEHDDRCTDDTCEPSGICEGEYGVVVTFDITENGQPYLDLYPDNPNITTDDSKDDLPSLAQKRFIAATYAAGQFDKGGRYFNKFKAVAGTPGRYTATAGALGGYGPLNWAPESTNGLVYGYVADELLGTESGGHVHMYDDVASDAVTFGTFDDTTAAPMANVAGCERCHGAPYMKHGYREAELFGTQDFVACKTCHYDTRNGGHEDWQILVEDPERYVEIAGGADLTPAEELQFAYKATLMNDVHMSHAMEFPYPQSMANCTVCHEGKLDDTAVLADTNFNLTTCKSCHPVNGPAGGTGKRAPALMAIWADTSGGLDVSAGHGAYTAAQDCTTGCHTDGGLAADFTELHNGGYNPTIYTCSDNDESFCAPADPPATKYADLFTVTVDTASFNSTTNVLTTTFTAAEDSASTVALDAEDIIPTILIGMYGYDTKDFIVAAHGRDDDDNRLAEHMLLGANGANLTNPRVTFAKTGASWTVNFDMSMWATQITDGIIKRVEIGVMPNLSFIVNDPDIGTYAGGMAGDGSTCTYTTSSGSVRDGCPRGNHCNASNACVANDDVMVALDAPSRTFDLMSGATGAFTDSFYSDITDVNNCNACHDALATTFHSPNRGGNVTVCRMCHVTLSAGSHLELQSRSIDSYVHAVHTFQAFDTDDIDFDDPVEALLYDHHVEHVFPNFTAKNCQSCHNAGMFNVPDQTKSLPGRLSGTFDVAGREIGTIPDLITGPGARACGGCHRAHAINEDDANRLAAFNQHTKDGGYLIEDIEDSDPDVLDVVIDAIFAVFE